MEKDTIDQLFETLKGQFDVEVPKTGHQQRFLNKLNTVNKVATLNTKKKSNWWQTLSIAATIAMLFSIGFYQLGTSESVEEQVAEISPEASKTQFYFANLIEQQVNELQLEKSPETEKIISDTMIQLQKLEKDYTKMEKDLLSGGNSKMILSAMINNFQTRIDLLNEVMVQIETIKNFKNTDNANYTI